MSPIYFTSEQWEYVKQLNDDIWVYYNAFTLPIMIIFCLYKLIYPVFWQNITNMKQFPVLTQDKILRPFIIYGPFYYLFDIIIKLGSGIAFKNACTASFFAHHICGSIFLPLGVWSRYVPWFFLVIGIGHAFLLVYYSKAMEYVYLISVLVYHYGILQPPFNKIWDYRMLHIGTCLLYLTVISLWLNGCSH